MRCLHPMIVFFLTDLCLAISPFSVKTVDQNLNGDELVIYRSLDSFVTVNRSHVKSFDNYYIVKTPFGGNLIDNLKKLGVIHKHQVGEYAIIEAIAPEEIIATVAHHDNGFCGAIQKVGPWSELPKNIKKKRYEPINLASERLDQVFELQKNIMERKIFGFIGELEGFGTRYHNSSKGIEVPSFILRKYKTLTPSKRTDVSFLKLDVEGSPQDNVVVRIVGAKKPDEKVILGAHIDSIVSFRGSAQAPGADDDASGVATNLEIFRVLMDHDIVFDRTVEFHGYAAEEIGLVGSANLAKQYFEDGEKVVAMVQMDMNLYSGRRDKLSKMWFIKNDTDKTLTADLMSFARRYQNVEPVLASLYGGTSDHRSWTDRGFVAAFPFENPRDYNRRIHTVDDKSSQIGHAKFSVLYARLGLAFLAHYAGIKKNP